MAVLYPARKRLTSRVGGVQPQADHSHVIQVEGSRQMLVTRYSSKSVKSLG